MAVDLKTALANYRQAVLDHKAAQAKFDEASTTLNNLRVKESEAMNKVRGAERDLLLAAQASKETL